MTNRGKGLTEESSTEDFIVQLALNIADFISFNSRAFSDNKEEAIGEYISASQIEEVKAAVLEALNNPEGQDELTDDSQDGDVQDEGTQDEGTQDNGTDNEADPHKQTRNGGEDTPRPSEDDLVPEDVMRMLDEN